MNDDHEDASNPFSAPRGRFEMLRTIGRVSLGIALLGAGLGHLTVQRHEFQAQVPAWLPMNPDVVVVASGVVEILLGIALLVAPRPVRPLVGWVTAAFFVAIFPGNISQLVTETDAFGLNTDAARIGRLFFQPVLVVWALWSTGAWRAWRASRAPTKEPRQAVPGSEGLGDS